MKKARRDTFLVYGSPLVTSVEVDAVSDVMRSGWLGTGPKVLEFEKTFAAYIGVKHAIALNSCTASLHLSMLAAGIGPGDEVITCPLTFCATANAIIHTGATPVFVDADFSSQNIDVTRIEKAISSRTKAILPIHFAGRPCNMDAIINVAQKYNLLIIEDAAHAIESIYKGKKIGSIGDMTCFSFYITKNIYTAEGGMVTTNDDEIASKIKMYGLHGMTKDAWSRYSDKGYKHYQVIFPGFKYNMTDISAALGLSQLPHIDSLLSRRIEIWETYNVAFADLPLQLPALPEENTTHARHLYTLLLDLKRLTCTRDEFMEALYQENIGTGVHYISLHLHPYYKDRFHFQTADFPVAARISERTLSLPLSPKLSDEDVASVISAVKYVCANFS